MTNNGTPQSAGAGTSGMGAELTAKRRQAAEEAAEKAAARQLAEQEALLSLYTPSQRQQNPYASLAAQLDGTTSLIRQGTDAAVSGLRSQEGALQKQAQSDTRELAAAYYASLSELNEAAANEGWSPLGGQARTERARALGTLTRAQTELQTKLQQNIASLETQIGQLVLQGNTAQASQLYDNLKLLQEERQRIADNEYRADAFDYQKEQDTAALALDEARLTGTYKGQETLAMKEYAESVRQFDAKLAEDIRQFGLSYALQARRASSSGSSSSSSSSSTGGSSVTSKEAEAIRKEYWNYVDSNLPVPTTIREAYNKLFGISSSPGSLSGNGLQTTSPSPAQYSSRNAVIVSNRVHTMIDQGYTKKEVLDYIAYEYEKGTLVTNDDYDDVTAIVRNYFGS